MTRPVKGILHDKTPNAIDLIKIGRKGLAMSDVEEICNHTKISFETLLNLICVSPDDLKEGKRLPKLPSSNLLLISNLYSKGYRIFKDKNAFYEWMNKRNGHLSAEVPFDLLDTAMGIGMIRKALEKALEPTTGIPALRGKVTPMTEKEIDNQLQQLKAEWERDFF